MTLAGFNLAGRNLPTFIDTLRMQSALVSVVAAAGGTTQAGDFREQVLPVVSRSTLPTPIGEGLTEPTNAATTPTKKFDVFKWPQWQPVTIEEDRNNDPSDLAESLVGSMRPTYPLGIDTYYLDGIAQGANITLVPYVVADPNSAIKAMWDFFTDKSYSATGVIWTRKGAVELGYATDTQARRMDMTESTGIPYATTGANLSQVATSKDVYGIMGPFDASRFVTSYDVMITRHPDATINGNGPNNGHVMYRGDAAIGHGNAYSSELDKSVTGAGFVVLHAP